MFLSFAMRASFSCITDNIDIMYEFTPGKLKHLFPAKRVLLDYIRNV